MSGHPRSQAPLLENRLFAVAVSFLLSPRDMGLHSDVDTRRRQLQRLLRTDYPALEEEFRKALGILDADIPPKMRGEDLIREILRREFPGSQQVSD